MKGLNGENLGETLFSTKGRISGWMYIFYTSAAYILFFGFTTIIPNILGTDNVGGIISLIAILALTILLLIILVINGIKRFHDIGKNGWNMFLLLIPLYNIIVSLNLLFKRGDKENNKYGTKPTELNKTMKTITVILFIVYCGIMVASNVIK